MLHQSILLRYGIVFTYILVIIKGLYVSAVPTLVKYLLNSFAILVSFLVIHCLVFIDFGRELDLFFCFPVISLITCYLHLVSHLLYLLNKAAQ